jgi:catalase
VSQFKGMLTSTDGQQVEVDKSHITTGSIMYDAMFVPGGKESVEAMKKQGDALHFLNEAFKHCKPIAATSEGVDLLMESSMKGVKLAEMGATGELVEEDGVLTIRDTADLDAFNQAFIKAIAQHRHWMREEKMQVPA